MKRLTILFLTRTWALGGAQTLISMFIRHLPRDRFNIITVPYDAPGAGDQDFINSIRSQGDDVAPDRIPWRHRSSWFIAREKIEELIDKYDVDIIHTHDNLSNVIVGLGRDRWQCACVASAYGWWEPRWNLKRRLYYWIERNVALPAFDRVYTVSNDMKGKILRGGTPDERACVIYTGLNTDLFKSHRSKQVIREEFELPENAIVVGSVGRLYKEKGHHLLLESVAALVADHPRLYALIVGTGYWKDTLEEQARKLGIDDRVVFTGYYDNLVDALGAIDIFAQPSLLEEGLPTSLLEAQAAGLPIIAADIGGTRETIEKGVTGELIQPGDVSGLSAAIRSLVEDEALRAKMSVAAVERIRSIFTVENMMEKMSETYSEAYEAYQNR